MTASAANKKDANLFFRSSGNLPLELFQFSFDSIESSSSLARIGCPFLKNLIEQPQIWRSRLTGDFSQKRQTLLVNIDRDLYLFALGQLRP